MQTDDKVFVPPIKIQGIKTKLVPMIRANVCIAPDTTWIEPFMGSGVVGFNTAPSTAIFADINPHIIAFYNQIKSGKITSQIVRAFLEEEGAILRERGEEHYEKTGFSYSRYKNTDEISWMNYMKKELEKAQN